jgi:hypothetical protein
MSRAITQVERYQYTVWGDTNPITEARLDTEELKFNSQKDTLLNIASTASKSKMPRGARLTESERHVPRQQLLF